MFATHWRRDVRKPLAVPVKEGSRQIDGEEVQENTTREVPAR